LEVEGVGVGVGVGTVFDLGLGGTPVWVVCGVAGRAYEGQLRGNSFHSQHFCLHRRGRWLVVHSHRTPQVHNPSSLQIGQKRPRSSDHYRLMCLIVRLITAFQAVIAHQSLTRTAVFPTCAHHAQAFPHLVVVFRDDSQVGVTE